MLALFIFNYLANGGWWILSIGEVESEVHVIFSLVLFSVSSFLTSLPAPHPEMEIDTAAGLAVHQRYSDNQNNR